MTPVRVEGITCFKSTFSDHLAVFPNTSQQALKHIHGWGVLLRYVFPDQNGSTRRGPLVISWGISWVNYSSKSHELSL